MISRIRRIFGFDKDTNSSENNKSNLQKIAETENDVLNKELEKKIFKFIPLREGDCLECKLISSSIVFGTSVYVMITAIRLTAKQQKTRGKLSVLIGGSTVSLALAMLAYARFFDVEFFSSKKPLPDHMNDEKTTKNLS